MVKGLDTFRRYFQGYENQYVLIGGAACDIVFENSETAFRATRDLDIVLIVEALTPEFGEKFWNLFKMESTEIRQPMEKNRSSIDLTSQRMNLFLKCLNYFAEMILNYER